MNRILSENGINKVLITPTYVDGIAMEIMLGNWTDQRLKGYHVEYFESLEDAMDVSFRYPSIDWNKIVSIHEDCFQKISDAVKEALSDGNFIVELDSELMDPTELKETMFHELKNSVNVLHYFIMLMM